MQFHDRRHAGRELAARLRIQQEKGALAHPVVLALPRGGVVVAREVADALEAPLDVLVARTIGAPSREAVGVGALTGEDPPLFDPDALDRLGLSESALADVVARERAEARRREELYRQGRPAPDLRDHTVIVVDDGLAAGATARAALRRVRSQSPERVVLAVPVCSPQAAVLLRGEADELLCLHRPGTFVAVSQWYERFDQVTDEEVLRALRGT
ncbi:phosphoribosyltransferase [Streptomyces sp. Go40/10]|uniref:phosphoribosyltransferase n=1 Tax=Streptomyces sp. Go40/10 TaxID=2825844 RepID=UPI001E3B5275|nr:phosphoribosyltransferase family protein [Streptomyces sp. Go40/10]UFR06295.1 phosphoribosyltransferase [Streptomyces sp. Go40/10]